jgi:uncharacterized membrane protein
MSAAIFPSSESPRANVLPRLDSIDVVRGLVMVVMLLDHMRDFTHSGSFAYDPLDPSRTTPWLYATRWITHLCAPTFVFLAGLSAGLQRLRGKPAPALARLLWTRGLWLVLLEVTVVRSLMWFNWHPSMLAFLQVIWAIGWSMIVLAALVRLPAAAAFWIGVAIALGHNLLDRFQVTPWMGPESPVPSALSKLWIVLHQVGPFPILAFPSPIVLAQYPVLPWVGVMLAGFGAAAAFAWSQEKRRRTFVACGLAMLGVFFVLRFTNLYGNPTPWAPGSNPTQTAMAFFNVSKYPPSALFVLVTLGLSLPLLGLLDGRPFDRGLGAILVTYGRVPFFFYLLQWVTAHLAGYLVALAWGRDLRPLSMNLVQIFSTPDLPAFGGPLWATYLCWAVGTVLLYFPCRWYARLKARRRDWWLTYV